MRDLQPYVGQTLEAKIIELDKNRNNVVLSRRAYLEETQKEQRDEFLTNLKPGEVRQGVVSSVVNFGAFVDLGGMDGLVHVSELSWKHVDHPGSVVQVGDEVTVQVLDVDLDRERISLSLKATQQDPWQEFASTHRGRRARLRPGHQARAVRRVRPGRRRHRGPGAHLRDGGPPRRAARAGRHARRGAVGQDHRPRPRSAAGSACRSSRPPRAASVAEEYREHFEIDEHGNWTAGGDDAEREAAWAEYYGEDGPPADEAEGGAVAEGGARRARRRRRRGAESEAGAESVASADELEPSAE